MNNLHETDEEVLEKDTDQKPQMNCNIPYLKV